MVSYGNNKNENAQFRKRHVSIWYGKSLYKLCYRLKANVFPTENSRCQWIWTNLTHFYCFSKQNVCSIQGKTWTRTQYVAQSKVQLVMLAHISESIQVPLHQVYSTRVLPSPLNKCNFIDFFLSTLLWHGFFKSKLFLT